MIFADLSCASHHLAIRYWTVAITRGAVDVE